MLLRIVGDIQITALISSNDRTLCGRLMLKKSRPIMLAGINRLVLQICFLYILNILCQQIYGAVNTEP